MSADLSDYDPETITAIPQSKLAIFIMSTYGEGDPSDNATQFSDWIAKAPRSSLASLRFAAFGLGNRNYQHYNRVVDVVDAALDRAGAQRLMPVGRADDADGATEEDFCRWKEDLFAFVANKLCLEEREVRYEPALSAVYDTSMEPIDLHHGHQVQTTKKGSGESPIKAMTIKHARELFQDKTRCCLHLEVALHDHPELVYKTGDHFGVWPVNPDQEVERLIRALGLTGNEHTPLSINPVDPAVKVQVPSPTTITALFRYYVEISACVSRETARAFAEFAPSPAARDWLLELCADRVSWSALLERTHVNFGRLLELAASRGEPDVWRDMPLTFVLENLPRMRPRYYSISSSSVLSPRYLCITALVSNKNLPGAGQQVPGLATNYLLAGANARHGVAVPASHPKDLSYELEGPGQALRGGKLFAHLRRSSFKLPALASCPLIMLAAGTGIAPFRAFIAERARLHTMGRDVGAMMLFFGCRHPEEDYIYQSELEAMRAALGGDKLRIVVAFSRLRAEKTYIQDKMGECAGEVVGLIEDGAAVYVCGRASMARAVGNTMGHVVGSSRGMSTGGIQEWLATMKRTRKWQEDVWA